MATIKSFTDISQSKTLSKILPLESADMKWLFWKEEIDAPKLPTFEYSKSAAESYKNTEAVYLPCWSLAALLGVLPEYNLQRTDWGDKTEYKIVVTIDEDNYASKNYDNPVNACVAMVKKLHELNLL